MQKYETLKRKAQKKSGVWLESAEFEDSGFSRLVTLLQQEFDSPITVLQDARDSVFYCRIVTKSKGHPLTLVASGKTLVAAINRLSSFLHLSRCEEREGDCELDGTI